jgi:hypothetical protein
MAAEAAANPIPNVAAWYFGKIVGAVIAFMILALGRTIGEKSRQEPQAAESSSNP